MEVRYISTYQSGDKGYPVAAYTHYGKYTSNPEYKLFCIHKAPGYNRRWNITHVPTGVAVGQMFSSRYRAIRSLEETLHTAKLYEDSFEGYFHQRAPWTDLNGTVRDCYKRIAVRNGGR